MNNNKFKFFTRTTHLIDNSSSPFLNRLLSAVRIMQFCHVFLELNIQATKFYKEAVFISSEKLQLPYSLLFSYYKASSWAETNSFLNICCNLHVFIPSFSRPRSSPWKNIIFGCISIPQWMSKCNNAIIKASWMLPCVPIEASRCSFCQILL